MPRCYFRNFGVGVNLHGRMGWRQVCSEPVSFGRCDPDYVHVRFETAEVRALWPEPPVPAEAPARLGDDEVAAWMLDYMARAMTAGEKPKRVPTIKLCMEATKGTKRQCERAWRPLPEALKRPRGGGGHSR